MSQENVEVVRGAVETLNRGGWDALVEQTTQDFQFDMSRAEGPLGGVFGRDEMMRFWADLTDVWDAVEFNAVECIEAGHCVVVPWIQRSSGRAGIAVEARVVMVFELRGPLIARATMYQSLDEALEAVGLRE